MSLPTLRRVRLRLAAPLGTKLTSGTLFGHLCWAIREVEDEAALGRWLAAQDEAPTLISDGFPADLLPKPLLAPAPRARDLSGDAAQAAKEAARRPWIPVAAFRSLRDRMTGPGLLAALVDDPWRGADDLADHRQAHNTIDRRRGTTLNAGGLYFVDEDWSFAHPDGRFRDVYVRSPEPEARLAALFSAIGASGYGRDATWGRGQFTVEAVEAAGDLDARRGDRFVSLSHGMITAGMRAPRYRLFTHFGKLGETAARAGHRPWKRPILLARPGATFAAEGDGPFGTLLRDVHQDAGWVRHDARHVAIRYSEVETR